MYRSTHDATSEKPSHTHDTNAERPLCGKRFSLNLKPVCLCETDRRWKKIWRGWSKFFNCLTSYLSLLKGCSFEHYLCAFTPWILCYCSGDFCLRSQNKSVVTKHTSVSGSSSICLASLSLLVILEHHMFFWYHKSCVVFTSFCLPFCRCQVFFFFSLSGFLLPTLCCEQTVMWWNNNSAWGVSVCTGSHCTLHFNNLNLNCTHHHIIN